MTKEKQDELEFIAGKAEHRLRERYLSGDAEHKNTESDFDRLTPLQLLYEAADELIDGLIYQYKAIKKLEELQ